MAAHGLELGAQCLALGVQRQDLSTRGFEFSSQRISLALRVLKGRALVGSGAKLSLEILDLAVEIGELLLEPTSFVQSVAQRRFEALDLVAQLLDLEPVLLGLDTSSAEFGVALVEDEGKVGPRREIVLEREHLAAHGLELTPQRIALVLQALSPTAHRFEFSPQCIALGVEGLTFALQGLYQSARSFELGAHRIALGVRGQQLSARGLEFRAKSLALGVQRLQLGVQRLKQSARGLQFSAQCLALDVQGLALVL
ncbi:MAG: hypothetical protein ACLP7Q_22820, partial [Isosphaeraceae bacterium]